MAPYLVYLEIAADGRCLAHVPEWPGCVLSGTSRDRVLRELPQAIRDHQVWLEDHGEPAPPVDEPVTIEIGGESTGYGPFDPGDAAALLPSDQTPVSAEEIEHHIRLMTYSRADLLALVQHLPDSLLDWQPNPESFTLRRMLRHVGNAEEWYISRLFPPEALPPEWEDDERLPLWEFLEMERRTSIAQLRQIDADESSRVLYPTRWTEHPEEAWTARKALRRFLEHERQHAAQARRILAAYFGYL